MPPGHAESSHCFRQATPIERHLFVGLAAPFWPRAVASPCWRIQPRFDAAVLGMLPDKELPEVSQALVERLREPDYTAAARNTASLIHRYGDASVVPQVAGYLDENLGKHACAIQGPLLAYLLKQDPAAARPRLEQALAARGPADGLCCHCIPTGVGNPAPGRRVRVRGRVRAADPAVQQAVGRCLRARRDPGHAIP